MFDINIFPIKNYLKLSKKEILSYIKLFNDFICYNQGELAEYIFSASEKHKEIRKKLQKMKTKSAKSNLNKLCSNFETFLDNKFKNICKKNFEYILKYFENRAWIQPRVCIKIYNDGNDGSIVTLFRNETLIPNNEYPVNANTAFQKICETGSSFLCNDIPSAIQKKEYKNARINEQMALNYKLPNKLKKMYFKYFKIPDKKWIDCWEKPKMNNGDFFDLSPEICYKSTLVIPMTLINNTLSVSFKKHFQIDINNNISPKSIYGFLCFDNHTSDFFKKEQDTSAGYIFADILSLYLIIILNYTTFSSTFNKAKTLKN